METWALQNPFLTFFLVLPALFVVRCAFKALGGGYWPRRHCPGCECNAVVEHDDEEDECPEE